MRTVLHIFTSARSGILILRPDMGTIFYDIWLLLNQRSRRKNLQEKIKHLFSFVLELEADTELPVASKVL